MATVDWDSITIAGAFVVGATLATVATLHLVRTVLRIRDKD